MFDGGGSVRIECDAKEDATIVLGYAKRAV
jgi:hypothetical protein